MRKGAKPDCHSLGPAAGIVETGEPGWPRPTLGPMQQAGWGHLQKTPEPNSSSLGCPLALQQGLGETHSQLGIRRQLHQLVLGKTTNTNRPLCSHNFPTSSPQWLSSHLLWGQTGRRHRFCPGSIHLLQPSSHYATMPMGSYFQSS